MLQWRKIKNYDKNLKIIMQLSNNKIIPKVHKIFFNKSIQRCDRVISAEIIYLS